MRYWGTPYYRLKFDRKKKRKSMFNKNPEPILMGWRWQFHHATDKKRHIGKKKTLADT